ncbi:MAG: DUF1501 domain-containing protein [Pirellulaceae bacterium]
MKCTYSCGSPEHLVARRQFLGGVSAGTIVGGLGFFARPSSAETLAKKQMRVLCVNMSGGLSQLESWDPKPGTDTGGPFRPIATTVPGMHICELLPETAQVMHHLSLVRSINTKENDHGKGHYFMFTGRRQSPAMDYPRLGAVASKTLVPDNASLPGHIQITPGGGGGRANDAAYLGPKYASVSLGNGKPPQYSTRPDSISEAVDQQRNQFRQMANDRFAAKRRTAMTDAYTSSFEQAQELMRQRDVFDVSQEPARDQDRYGKHDFGRHCLLARRLLEKGITFVQVSHSNYDTHYENFDFHIEQLGEFDKPFATLVTDIADRGMLESTLIVVLSEFGRTPRINANYGRDHWGTAWSICLGGARVQRGAIIGKTNKNGTAVTDREVDGGHLFHTYLQAVGVDSTGNFEVDGRDLPIADPTVAPVEELLA